MLANDLKVNGDKTEILLISSPYFMRKKTSITFYVADITVSSVEKVTHLGVVLIVVWPWVVLLLRSVLHVYSISKVLVKFENY